MTVILNIAMKAEMHRVTVPDDLPADKRLRLSVALFDAALLSNGNAAKMAGLSRVAFLGALGQFDVTPFQYDAEEILADAKVAAT